MEIMEIMLELPLNNDDFLGCKTVPTLNSTSKPLGVKCPPSGRGWVNAEGKDTGS